MIRVMIAEDQGMLRGALGSLLDFENDIKVIAQAQNGEDALKLALELKPDVCLLDIEMPIKTGLEVAVELRDKLQDCRVMILTTFARPGYFERALKAGVYGYLLKDGSVDNLAEAIRGVMKGKKEFDPELIMNSYKADNPLTEREQEILTLAAKGNTSREISGKLFLSAGTVRNYMSEVLHKLDAKNKIEAISKAKEKGWIE